MKELSLNILDIVENSIKAEAELVKIEISESDELLSITITDDGTGMDEETLRSVTDPFYTTRTTRKVGMGMSWMQLYPCHRPSLFPQFRRTMTCLLPWPLQCWHPDVYCRYKSLR